MAILKTQGLCLANRDGYCCLTGKAVGCSLPLSPAGPLYQQVSSTENSAYLCTPRLIDVDVHSLRLWFLQAVSAHLTILTCVWVWIWVIVRLG
jgi:hypothetical protein